MYPRNTPYLLTYIDPTLLDGTGYPVTGHVTPGNINHYYLSVQDNPLGQVLQISVHNIKGGTLTTFFNFGEPAGSCPCYQSQYSFEGKKTSRYKS